MLKNVSFPKTKEQKKFVPTCYLVILVGGSLAQQTRLMRAGPGALHRLLQHCVLMTKGSAPKACFWKQPCVADDIALIYLDNALAGKLLTNNNSRRLL